MRRHTMRVAGAGCLAVAIAVVAGSALVAQQETAPTARDGRLQEVLDAWREEAGAPGVTVGIALPDGTDIGLASGVSDRTSGTPMRPDDLMLAGSTGKTFFAAVAAQMIAAGELDLDAPISRYLGDRAWFDRIANAEAITVRHLMTHTSGIVRYEMKPEFTSQLVASPDRTWTPEQEVAFLLDEPAPFAPGEGWEYSDTNYIVLGMILEELLERPLYDEVDRRFLSPLGLRGVVPSTSRRVPGLIPGYAGENDPLGLPDQVLVDGEFVINPQFEWTGGGYATSAPDLARWGRALYHDDALSPEARELMIGAAVPARLGPETRYGLGVIVRASTPAGPTWGHSGFFPGYISELVHLVDSGVTLAVQVNTSARRAPGSRSPLRLLFDLAAALERSAASVGGPLQAPARGRPLPPGGVRTSSIPGYPLSAVAMASLLARHEAGRPRMELIVLWRGEPGWHTQGRSSSGGGTRSSGGGTSDRYAATFTRGRLTLTFAFEFASRILTIEGESVELGDDNVVLVDFVDRETGLEVVGTTRVDPLVPPTPAGRMDVEGTLRTSPEAVAFIRCNTRLEDARLQTTFDIICGRLSGRG